MGTFIAFLSTAAVLIAVQSMRWGLARPRSSAPVTWGEYMRSARSWVGWPLALAIALYMLVILATLATAS